MTVTQMLAHSKKPLMVALGEHQIKRGLMALLFGKMVKKQYTSPEPLKHKQPTSKSFIIKGVVNFEEEREKLKQNLNAFSELGEAGKLPAANPFFGKLTSN
jgi:mRNA-degrading endonuclease HigB of HigAB toxin-antitoxin module